LKVFEIIKVARSQLPDLSIQKLHSSTLIDGIEDMTWGLAVDDQDVVPGSERLMGGW
jgi:hypothetical protein